MGTVLADRACCLFWLQTAMDMGAVTDLRYVKRAISTARMVMAHSLHSSLGGLQATSFAVEMGAKLSNLSTPTSSDMYYAWCATPISSGIPGTVQHTCSRSTSGSGCQASSLKLLSRLI